MVDYVVGGWRDTDKVRAKQTQQWIGGAWESSVAVSRYKCCAGNRGVRAPCLLASSAAVATAATNGRSLPSLSRLPACPPARPLPDFRAIDSPLVWTGLGWADVDWTGLGWPDVGSRLHGHITLLSGVDSPPLPRSTVAVEPGSGQVCCCLV